MSGASSAKRKPTVVEQHIQNTKRPKLNLASPHLSNNKPTQQQQQRQPHVTMVLHEINPLKQLIHILTAFHNDGELRFTKDGCFFWRDANSIILTEFELKASIIIENGGEYHHTRDAVISVDLVQLDRDLNTLTSGERRVIFHIYHEEYIQITNEVSAIGIVDHIRIRSLRLVENEEKAEKVDCLHTLYLDGKDPPTVCFTINARLLFDLLSKKLKAFGENELAIAVTPQGILLAGVTLSTVTDNVTNLGHGQPGMFFKNIFGLKMLCKIAAAEKLSDTATMYLREERSLMFEYTIKKLGIVRFVLVRRAYDEDDRGCERNDLLEALCHSEKK